VRRVASRHSDTSERAHAHRHAPPCGREPTATQFSHSHTWVATLGESSSTMVLKRVFDDSDAGAAMRRLVDDAGRATDARAGVAAGMKAAAEAVRPRRAAARASISSGISAFALPYVPPEHEATRHESATVHKQRRKERKRKTVRPTKKQRTRW
jgi:hypothetical protein